jgi:tetratricopeptide (TPR) repeat protein
MAPAHMAIGNVYFKQGNFETALKHYQSAITIDDKLAPAFMLSGNARLKLGDSEGALERVPRGGQSRSQTERCAATRRASFMPNSSATSLPRSRCVRRFA